MNIQMTILVNSRDIWFACASNEITVNSWHWPCNVPQLTRSHAGQLVPTDRRVCVADCCDVVVRQTERRGRFVCLWTYLQVGHIENEFAKYFLARIDISIKDDREKLNVHFILNLLLPKILSLLIWIKDAVRRRAVL